MQFEQKTWLADIRRAIEEIEEFLPEPNTFLQFEKDKKGQRAIERLIEIIGEAVNRILKSDPDFPITNARRIVNTRNKIIHGYESVSADIIWAIITRELPNLKAEVINLLAAGK